MDGGRDYGRFARDFIRSHTYHDATDAYSRNEHKRNLGTIEDLLLGNRPIVEKYFGKGPTDKEKLSLILDELESGERVDTPPSYFKVPSKEKHVRAMNFCSTLTTEAVSIATDCFNKCGFFKETLTPDITAQFLEHTLPHPLTSGNNRCIVLFFDALYSFGFITRYWKTVVENRKCILRSSGQGYVTAKDLYSAAYAITNRRSTSKDVTIQNYLNRIFDIMPKDGKCKV